MIGKKPAILLLALAAGFLLACGGCASLNSEHFVPNPVPPAENARRMDGSVFVQADVPAISRGGIALFHGGALRVALEKSIAQEGLFRRIEQGDADYVLDVWVDDATRRMEVLGGYIIDVTAVWRLTRSRDGEEIACDDVTGHGASHAFGTNAHVEALESATRQMIRNGLSMLADRSMPAQDRCVAADWPSMGPVIPEGYRRMKENWSKLREGLTEEEVRKMVPSMKYASRTNSTRNAGGPGGGPFLQVVVYEGKYSRLTFLGGRLERWELRK